MSYGTYTFGKDDFTVAPDLKDIQITTDADLESMQYTIRAKCGLDTPLSRVLELMEMGMSITVTLADGKKHKLCLVREAD